ncbi:MAG: tripartite tricarboxylate transporter TctB family protein [Trueperaceae bacterium]|nr:tripartite tricarboxylate transporter TctB family protein [Trueperaceae bacterium]
MKTARAGMNTDALGGLFGLGLTLLFWFGRRSWSPLSAMFPNTVLITMGALSVGLLIQSLVRREVRPVFAEGNRTRIVATAVVLFAWIWAIRYLGFYLAGLVFFTGLTLYIASASRRLTARQVAIWTAIVAVELTALYFVFTNLLAVRLPAGVFAP